MCEWKRARRRLKDLEGERDKLGRQIEDVQKKFWTVHAESLRVETILEAAIRRLRVGMCGLTTEEKKRGTVG